MANTSIVSTGMRPVSSEDFGDDATVNLLQFASRELPPETMEDIRGLVDQFRRAMEHNLPLTLSYNTIVQPLPADVRERVEALIFDLEVQFLRKRYDLLRLVLARDVPPDLLHRLLETYCLNTSGMFDPEMPGVAARVVVEHMSEWELVSLVHQRVEHLLDERRGTRHPEGDARAEPGRLTVFLRWVPYRWSEDLLLTLLEKLPFDRKSEHVRFHVSVLRSLFFRPRIQGRTVQKLCGLIRNRFGPLPPPSLRSMLRAVLISGGREAYRYLAGRIEQVPGEAPIDYFLEIMISIDKVAAARWLETRHDLVLDRISPRSYVKPAAMTGEPGRGISGKILSLWDDADSGLKTTILEAIDKLHCENACSFLMDRLGEEKSTAVRLMIMDTIAGAGGIEETISLCSHPATGHPLIYFHAIDLCHRRLLADPVTLAELKDLSLLYHFEAARAQIFRIYRLVLNFDRLVSLLLAFAEDHREAFEHHTLRIEKDFSLAGLNADKTGAPRVEAIEEIRERRERHLREMPLCEELCEILDCAPEFNPRHSDDIFGRTRARFPRAGILSREELSRFPEAGNDIHKALAGLSRKARHSAALIREYFLYKEWFVRRAPFVLHDGIEDLVRRVGEGRAPAFDPQHYLDASVQKRLRGRFRIFAECTKQGVYLTDVLLEYLEAFSPEEIPVRVAEDLTHRRSLIARGEEVFVPERDFDRHLVFTTFAHIYRYGKESMDRPSIIYLWLRFTEAARTAARHHGEAGWPLLPRHPETRPVVGPLVERMYEQHARDALRLRDYVMGLYERFHPRGIRMRVIPNITYGLFCLAPVIMDIVRKGIHVSLAGVSSRYCDDMNISEFTLSDETAFPVKPYLFSTASNYGTLNHDRVLVVVDGTMEPLDRHTPSRARLPRAHRGYLNHVVAINYVRSRYGYRMDKPEREVAAALNLSERYVRNLVRTVAFRRLVRSLLLSFDFDELRRFQIRTGCGRTYYTFAQWNPDGLGATSGSRGYEQREIPCARVDDVTSPVLLFANINGVRGEGKIPAFFDNNPEVEKSRIVLGPRGVRLDTGWPHPGEKGVVIDFPEGENR